MNVKLVIFDLDGTLMNTSPGIFATANKAVQAVGHAPEHDINQLSKFIGPPIIDCFINTYNLDKDLIPKAIEYYRAEYAKSGQYNAEEYPKMRDTLAQLKKKGYLLAVGTLKHESLAKSMMDHFGFSSFFDSIRGADLESKLTKSDIVNNVLEDLSVLPSESVLIGDTVHDLNGALGSKVSFIAVDYGFGFPKGQQKTKDMMAVISQADELLTLL